MNYAKIKKDCKSLKNYAQKNIIIGKSILKFVTNFEKLIVSLGYKPAFPVNIAQKDIIAHWTPKKNCAKKFTAGLCIIDFGLELGEIIVDTAMTIPLGSLSMAKYGTKIANYRKKIERLAKNTKPPTKIISQITAIEKIVKEQGWEILPGLGGHNILPGNLHGNRAIPHSFLDCDQAELTNYGTGYFCIEPFIVLPDTHFEIYNKKSPIYQYVTAGRTFYTCDRWSDYSLGTNFGQPVDMLVADRSIILIQEQVCIHVTQNNTTIISS